MTVAELIRILSDMPEDAVVIYNYHSDYSVLEGGDVKLWRAEEQKVV